MHIRRFLFTLFAAVALSPPFLAAQSKTAGTIPSTGGGASCVSINVDAQATVAIQVTGTWTGTLQPKISLQGQTAQNTQITPSTSPTPASTITANGVYRSSVAGGSTFLVCGNTVASGTANVYLNATTASAGSGGIGGGSGTVASGTVGQPAVYTGATTVGSTPAEYYAISNGISNLACDGSSDDTAAFNSLLSGVHTAGGGTIKFPPNKTCLFNSAQITLPNNADSWTDGAGSISSQNPIRLTCGGPVNYYQLMSSGATVAQINSSCVLNFTFAATNAKLVTLGLGRLEVDHLSFINTNVSGADCVPFILTTNTELNLHDNSLVGGTGGGTPCQDLVQFGGTDANPGKLVSSPFQGYGTLVQGNFFNQCRRAIYGLADAGSIPVERNTIWSQCSFPTGAAIDFDCSTGANSGCHGLMIDDNIIEVANYKYGIRLKATSNHELRSNPCWDQSGSFTSCIRYESGAAYNFVSTAFMTGGTVQYVSTDGSAGVYSNLLFSAGAMSNNGPMTESVGIRIDPFNNNMSPDILVPKVGQTSAGFSSTCNDPTTKCKSFYSMTPTGLQIAYNRQPTNGSYYDTTNGSSDIFFESNAIDFFGAPANTALTNWWQMDSSGNFVSKLAGGALQAQVHTTTSFNGAVQTQTEAPCETAGATTTLGTGATTTDTGLNCLPANAVIDAVVYRITTNLTFTGATGFTIGDATTAARFCATQSLFTANTTGVCFVQADQTGAAGPRQTAAAKVRITSASIPTGGVMRLIVFYHTWTAPTS